MYIHCTKFSTAPSWFETRWWPSCSWPPTSPGPRTWPSTSVSAPFAPEESKKNEGGSCPTGRGLPPPPPPPPPPPCNAARSQRWLLALLLELLLPLLLPLPPVLLPPLPFLLPFRCCCSINASPTGRDLPPHPLATCLRLVLHAALRYAALRCVAFAPAAAALVVRRAPCRCALSVG